MVRKCSITGKKANNGYQVSHSHIRTKKLQQVNLQMKRIWNQKLQSWQKIKLSTKAIKKLIIKS
uniref:Large ribosomal subunit protein bL28c n=1 Tax=Compsopogon caeruleus TaxID=31354 RepID=A0A1Z1XAZ5_9RHOD|nr:chloroplast 50S ribosomal protein L28 [Compsopogon caeruleus]ARX96035.1 chloroplast 50S ribosomal protein L28 [Compsopogon caeruleus]